MNRNPNKIANHIKLTYSYTIKIDKVHVISYIFLGSENDNVTDIQLMDTTRDCNVEEAPSTSVVPTIR